MHDLFRLVGKVALVTGAAGGLGSAIATLFAESGAAVALLDSNAQGCAAAAAGLHQRGFDVLDVTADLRNQAMVESAVDRVLGHFGRIDILVCNAGIQGPAGPLHDVTDLDWESVMTVNLRSQLWLTSRVIPQMAESGAGSVILMASIAGIRGNKTIGLYGLSKAAVAQLARNLAVEWGPKNIRVNALSPGVIRTPLASELLGNASFMERRLSLTPLRRVGEPAEVATAALFLASAAGGFVTGHNLVIDGGTVITDGN
jgi:NAD(P)-dependent dehydrogenase (short-subunit alcohol dehydrogenase family)